jgi:hypothetical protein
MMGISVDREKGGEREERTLMASVPVMREDCSFRMKKGCPYSSNARVPMDVIVMQKPEVVLCNGSVMD